MAESTNLSVRFETRKDGHVYMITESRVMPSYANQNEDGTIKSIVCASSGGLRKYDLPPGLDWPFITVNHVTLLPKAVSKDNPRGAVKRIALDAKGNPITK